MHRALIIVIRSLLSSDIMVPVSHSATVRFLRAHCEQVLGIYSALLIHSFVKIGNRKGRDFSTQNMQRNGGQFLSANLVYEVFLLLPDDFLMVTEDIYFPSPCRNVILGLTCCSFT